MDWLAVAKTLGTGSKTRIQCCAHDKSMIVSSSPNWWSAYCFRCGTKGRARKHDLSLSELAEIRRRESQFMQAVKLPSDFVTELPAAEQLWLWKASITEDIQAQFGIGYSPSMGRVIIPVYDGTRLTGVTARNVKPGAKPKYLTTQEPGCFFKAGAGDTLVVVEDILSAIRVSKFTATAALLGTHPSNSFIGYALSFPHVVCWFDPDAAGSSCTEKTSSRLRAFGADVKIIRTAKDPKLYSSREIQEILKEVV